MNSHRPSHHLVQLLPLHLYPSLPHPRHLHLHHHHCRRRRRCRCSCPRCNRPRLRSLERLHLRFHIRCRPIQRGLQTRLRFCRQLRLLQRRQHHSLRLHLHQRQAVGCALRGCASAAVLSRRARLPVPSIRCRGKPQRATAAKPRGRRQRPIVPGLLVRAQCPRATQPRGAVGGRGRRAALAIESTERRLTDLWGKDDFAHREDDRGSLDGAVVRGDVRHRHHDPGLLGSQQGPQLRIEVRAPRLLPRRSPAVCHRVRHHRTRIGTRRCQHLCRAQALALLLAAAQPHLFLRQVQRQRVRQRRRRLGHRRHRRHAVHRGLVHLLSNLLRLLIVHEALGQRRESQRCNHGLHRRPCDSPRRRR